MAIEEACCQKYGVPLFGASWVPTKKVILFFNQQQEEENPPIEDNNNNDEQQQKQEDNSNHPWIVLCGGGGAGNSGIPNSLLLSQYHYTSKSLSPTPISRFGTGSDVPYRMAVHPGGEGVICSFPNSCRWFEWDVHEIDETPKLELRSSERVLTQLEDVGQQIAMAFSSDGSTLAVGGEDGHLRVFKWPSMEVILDQIDDANASSVKYLNFSSDCRFLVSLGSRGSCRVWDVSSAKIVASLPKEKGEDFRFCQFSLTEENTQILYIIAIQGKGVRIVSWDTTSWKRIGSTNVVDAVSAINVSADGKLVAVGTAEGGVCIMDSSMRVQNLNKKAHLGPVTVLMFSEDSRSLVSASMDSSARVTLIENKKSLTGLSISVILFIVLLAILAYFLKSRGAI